MIFIIAISLSMDAFSLSLLYGTMNKNNNFRLSIIVGIYHFIMPLLGMTIGNKIAILNSRYIIMAIFVVIGVQMLIETFKHKKITELNIFSQLLFGLAVSIDSFTVGLTLNMITNNCIQSAFIFALTSLTFTYLGLKLGNYINKKIGKYSTIIGGIILILIGLKCVM